MNDMKTILVTGGAGFIGSFLCEELIREGHRVICIDDFSTGKVYNIEPYLRNPQFQFVRHDLNFPIDLEKIPELEAFQIPFHGIQEVYHLAVPTSIKQFDKFIKHTALSSSLATHNALEIATKYKARFLFASSSVVYGTRNAEVQVFDEKFVGTIDHLSSRAVYDEGKRFAETMVDAYARTHELEVRIARIFRTYGPHMPLFDGHQIPDFALAVLNNEPIIMNVGPEFKTSLMYVTDAVDGLIRLMRSKSNPGPVNIGSDQDLKIVDVAKMIMMIAGNEVPIEHREGLNFLSELGLPSIVLAKEQLGWLPLVRLEDGLRKTIDYIRANKILLTGEQDS
jgi:UDP-glucuronate decarboxylase